MNMNIIGLLLVISIVIGFTMLTRDHASQSGGMDPSYVKISSEKINSPYLKQYNELDNVDNVLKRQQYPANPTVNAIIPNDEKDIDNMEKLPFESIDYIPVYTGTPSIKALIESKQPYFLDEALIVTYYGVPHYWDWRYPRQPIPIEFAQDPAKFRREHPSVYPSYLGGDASPDPSDPAGATCFGTFQK